MQIFIMPRHLVAEISRFKFDDCRVIRAGASDLILFWAVYIILYLRDHMLWAHKRVVYSESHSCCIYIHGSQWLRSHLFLIICGNVYCENSEMRACILIFYFWEIHHLFVTTIPTWFLSIFQLVTQLPMKCLSFIKKMLIFSHGWVIKVEVVDSTWLVFEILTYSQFWRYWFITGYWSV